MEKSSLSPELQLAMGPAAGGGGMPPPEVEPKHEPVAPHEDYYKSCDIVVLGGGGAGLVAAARISEISDKSVIVVEKRRSTGGGANGAADFKVYNSRWQKDRGIHDNTMEALRDVMDKTYWQLDPKLAYNTFKASGEFFDFLCDTGEGVEDLYTEGTYVFDGPDGPKIPAFKEGRKGGAYVMKRMKSICEKNGVEILTGLAANDVIKEGCDFVVTASDEGGKTIIRAKACILATGSWIRNEEVIKKHLPKLSKMKMAGGAHTHPSYTGDAIKISESLGAYIDYGSFCVRLMGPLGMCPSQTLMSMAAEKISIQVNKDGKRWINESTQKRVGIFDTGNVLIDQPDFCSFYLFDQAMIDFCADRFKNGYKHEWCFPASPSYNDDYHEELENTFNAPERPGPPGMSMGKSFARADSIEELAEIMGIDKESLKATVDNYNKMCETKVDSEYFKDPEDMMPLIKAPFYAVRGDMGTDGAFGGVLVNQDIEAYAANKENLVKGLYVPGDFSSGRFINVCGNKIQIINDLAWAFSSGWIAAKSAVDFLS